MTLFCDYFSVKSNIGLELSLTQMLFSFLLIKKNIYIYIHIHTYVATSLVVQWIRIHLPMQGTWVVSLIQEDPTCLKPRHPRACCTTGKPALGVSQWRQAPTRSS